MNRNTMTLLNCFVLALVISSCAKSSKKAQTKLSLNVASLVSGSSQLNNGAILVGHSLEGDFFSIGINNPSNFGAVNINFGNWTFAAIGWQESGAHTENLKGTAYCGVVSNRIIENQSENVSLQMNPNNCLNADFSAPSDRNGTDLKTLKLVNCLHDNSPADCNGALNIGVNASFRVGYLGLGINKANNQPYQGIFSKCLSNTDLNNSILDSGLSIPIQGREDLFPLVIKAYENTNCKVEEDLPIVMNIYKEYQGRPFNSIDVDMVVFDETVSQKLKFIDNYVGFKGNGIFNAAAPEAHCGTAGNYVSCVDSTVNVQPHNLYSDSRNMIWEILGNQDLVQVYDLGRLSNAKAGLETGTPDSNPDVWIEFNSKNPGEQLNGTNISFIHDGAVASGAAIINYDTISKNLQIKSKDATADQIITALVGDSEVIADFEITVHGDNATAVDLATNVSVSMIDGEGPRDPRRSFGNMGDIYQLLKGPIDGILSKEGYADCQSVFDDVSTGNILNFTHNVANHFVELKVAKGTLADGEIPGTFANAAGTYANFMDLRIGLFLNGQLEELFETECDAAVGWTYYQQIEPGRDDKEETYYNASSLANLDIEVYSRHTDTFEGREGNSIKKFQKDGGGTHNFSAWFTHTGTDGSSFHYERFGMKSAGTSATQKFEVTNFKANSASDTSTNILANDTTPAPDDIQCLSYDGTELSQGTGNAGGCTLVTTYPALIPNSTNFSIQSVDNLHTAGNVFQGSAF